MHFIMFCNLNIYYIYCLICITFDITKLQASLILLFSLKFEFQFTTYFFGLLFDSLPDSAAAGCADG